MIEAEQFKVTVEPPPPGNQNLDVINLVSREGDTGDDDDYFHLVCHVDSTLKVKIERGEYVELEKLLPRKQTQGDGRLEWVSKDGMTFLAPAQDRDYKISNIKKWDQAFRVYAAIYCNANPGRAGEIWQYIYTIHTAASSYHWENVAHYDATFWQMMGDRPHRSWAKMYTQLWQLSLKDPIQKSGWQGNASSS